jgi:hypothetical protein
MSRMVLKDPMIGEHEGVRWTKVFHESLSQGYTVIMVNDVEMKFYGHTSNARAWTFIDRNRKKRGSRVENGVLYTAVAR